MTNRKATKRRIAPPVGASSASNSSEIRGCLITVGLTGYRPNIFHLGTNHYTGHPAWAGVLFDSADFIDSRGIAPVAQIFTKSDTTLSRDCVIRDLQEVAFKEGFSHCEVRNYFNGDSDAYATLSNAPLPYPKASQL